jgi:hypothetical protein
MTLSPDSLELAAALDDNGTSIKAPVEKSTPITIRISGSGWQLETMISLEIARKVVQCINQSND